MDSEPLPTVPGFEGRGTVVANGSGTMARFLRGKPVACTVADAKIPGGMWAEYVVTSAQMCIPLAKNITMEQGAMMLVNPISAWAMVDEARKAEHKAIVNGRRECARQDGHDASPSDSLFRSSMLSVVPNKLNCCARLAPNIFSTAALPTSMPS